MPRSPATRNDERYASTTRIPLAAMSNNASFAQPAKAAAPAPAAAQPADGKPALPSLGILEEDDEFEDFPIEDWNEADENKEEIHAWEDNWDDDETTDDFSNQLRAEFQKLGTDPMEQ
ncbi:26S proteasome complex subunit [Blastocladiella emersonii ATCC 22665]|nr:26S proteasome complex subunit [Blastocladiella emersonii ATCC 22665]